MKDGKFAYSFDGEYYNYETLEEAIDSAVNYDEDLKVGEVITISQGVVVKRVPSDYFAFHNAMDIIEQIHCNASDEVGECADDMYYVPKEHVYELETIVQAWANKHMQCNFYAVVDTKEIQVTLTEEHFQ